MIKEHPKKYFIHLHFIERTDFLKAFTLKLLRPNELIQVNKEIQTPFSLLPLKLIETDHGKYSLETAVCAFFRRKKSNF